MPNGYHQRRTDNAGLCPHCNSSRIRTRRGRHRYMVWRCRNCNRVFATPGAGAETENRARRRGDPRRRRRNGGKTVIFTIAALVILAMLAGGAFGWLSNNGASNGTSFDQAVPLPTEPTTSVRLPTEAVAAAAPATRAAIAHAASLPTASTMASAASPADTPVPAFTLGPTATPAPTFTPAPVPPPELRHIAEKRYMLELINAERARAGLNPVILGDNIAAQLHADAALENCFSSHWGVDGLKPYMRYSLAAGYQSNGENGSGLDYCIKASDRYQSLSSIRQEIRETMAGWMSSSGHRSNILDPSHRKVSIGLAWDRYNAELYQHFEGDYVEYDRLPTIANGSLSLSGTAKNGVRFGEPGDLGVDIYYDPPPHELTGGQVARTYCYDSGRQVASLREPLTGGYY